MGVNRSKNSFQVKKESIIKTYIIYNDDEQNATDLKCRNKKANKDYELKITCFRVG